jgi:hypothetical protein
MYGAMLCCSTCERMGHWDAIGPLLCAVNSFTSAYACLCENVIACDLRRNGTARVCVCVCVCVCACTRVHARTHVWSDHPDLTASYWSTAWMGHALNV